MLKMKNQKFLNKGFTLIELLVVIAIIGILSSVVLASLNTARGKGNDAKVKSQLAGLRASAEIFYDTNGSYGAANTTCSGGTAVNMFADTASGMAQYTNPANYPSGATPVCRSSASAYAVSAPLPGAGTGNFWCVDSLGTSKLTTAAISSTVCP